MRACHLQIDFILLIIPGNDIYRFIDKTGGFVEKELLVIVRVVLLPLS